MRHDATYVINAICTPSRAAILTGTYNHVDVTTLCTEIDIRMPNVAKHLRRGGYCTGMFGKWHMGEGPAHNPTGFDDWAVVPGQGDCWDPKFIFPDGDRRIPGYGTDIITDMSVDFIEKSGDQPFFLMCHHKAPHRNFEPHPKYSRHWANEDIPLPETFNDHYSNRAAAAAAAKMRIRSDMNYEGLGLVTPASKVGPLMLDFIPWMRKVPELMPNETITVICSETVENFTFDDTQKFAEFKYQRYLRTVASIDENVGCLLDYLDEKSLAENTIVIYTSDHGFFLGEHGWFDKRFMYEESLQISSSAIPLQSKQDPSAPTSPTMSTSP